MTETGSTVERVRSQYEEAYSCPQHEKSGGEKICGGCLDDLGWLAVDHMGALLAVVEAVDELFRNAHYDSQGWMNVSPFQRKITEQALVDLHSQASDEVKA